MPRAQNAIVVYHPDETLRLETLYSNESIWLTQLKIAELFGVQKAAVSKHLKNIFATGELDRAATVSKMETVRPLPRHRRPNPLRHRRLPEGHGPQVLRVHETGLRGNRATEGEDMTP